MVLIQCTRYYATYNGRYVMRKRGQVLIRNKRNVLNAYKVEHKVREKYSLLRTVRFKVTQRQWWRFNSSRTRQSAERRHIPEELHIQ